MNLELSPDVPIAEGSAAMVRWVVFEVLQFRRILGLLLACLLALFVLGMLLAVATPSYSRRRAAACGPDGYFELGPRSDADWTWQRLVEVADGIRPFESEDQETFRRQRLAIDRLVDWFSQDPWWTDRKGTIESATLRWKTHCEELQAIAFHLDGLDANGDAPRYAIVFEAGLRYVEHLLERGRGRDVTRITPALAGGERLLRQLLRHVARGETTAGERARWIQRLQRHLAVLEDPEPGARRQGLLPSDADLMRAAREESDWPWRPEKFQLAEVLPRYRITRPIPPERDLLEAALRMDPAAALAYLGEKRSERERHRLPEKAPLLDIVNVLLVRTGSLPFRREAPWARDAFVRWLEWRALRRGVMTTLLRLDAGSSVSHTPESRDPFSARPLVTEESAGFRVSSAGPDGIDESGAGDDLPIWPPAPVQSPGLRSLPRPPVARMDVSPRSVRPGGTDPLTLFEGPETALATTMEVCVRLGLRVTRLRATRPGSSRDLQRARVEVTVEKDRFHQLVEVLQAPEVAAIGGRGQLTRLSGDLRRLSFDIGLEPRPPSRAGVGTTLALEGRVPLALVARARDALRGRDVLSVTSVELVRAGGRWVLAAGSIAAHAAVPGKEHAGPVE